MGGKVLVPTSHFIRTLIAARLAADVLRRADAARRPHRRRQRQAAHLATSTSATARSSHRRAHGRGLLPHHAAAWTAPSPAAWPTRPTPTCSGARPRPRTSTRPAASPRPSTRSYPGKLLAYNCSPSFNWKKNLDDATIARFQRELGGHGLQVPVRHPGRLPRAEPRHVRAGARLPGPGHGRLLRAAAARSSPPRRTATPPPATSARWAPATSTRWPRSSPAARRRPWPWTSPPRPSSSRPRRQTRPAPCPRRNSARTPRPAGAQWPHAQGQSPRPVAALLAATLTLTSTARAENASPSPLAKRVQAGLATVRVTFETGASGAVVELVERHRSRLMPLPVKPKWIGICLPDRQQVRTWLRQHQQHPQRALWQQALRRSGYEALVFLRSTDMETFPQCAEEEGLAMRHTDIHPEYARHVKRVMAAHAALPEPERIPVTRCDFLID